MSVRHLDDQALLKKKPMGFKAILFDFDGTLTKPGVLDFSVIRSAIDCPDNRPILEFIQGLPSKQDQAEALAVLERYETEAASKSEPNSGAEALIDYLGAFDIYIGIISRNSLRSIKRALENFRHTRMDDFDLIISRDDPVDPKPSPEAIFLASEKLNTDVKQMLVVGDYLFDIQAGNRAGAATVLLRNATEPQPMACESDYVISHMEELKQILRFKLPLHMGKLPNDFLAEFLEPLSFDDSSVLIHPGVGEDTTAVAVKRAGALVLKSDPITFVTGAIGEYAVLINANDIATSGAIPRWLLTTLLLPCGTTAGEIRQLMHEIRTVCHRFGISLCGGHTEITDAVTRPVVTGMLIGTVSKDKLIDKKRIRPGDRVLFTKSVAVEGTAILAREFEGKLEKLGLKKDEIERCKAFLSQISILKEARISARFQSVSAMHDVTEGGLATAVDELAIAGQHKITIDMDKIPVFPETQKICRILDLEPLGLIGSGSLLICCRKNFSRALMDRIIEAGIPVTCIGEVREEGTGVEAISRGKPVVWPRFEVDEVARFFRIKNLTIS